MYLKLLKLGCILFLAACASKQKPSYTWVEKPVRLLIDPDGISTAHFAQIEQALSNTEQFVLVDRTSNFEDVKTEAQIPVSKFSLEKKYIYWANKYDVGGVVVAHVQCNKIADGEKQVCKQFIAIKDATSGKTIATAEGVNSDYTGIRYEYLVPDWKETVASLITNYRKALEAQRTTASD